MLDDKRQKCDKQNTSIDRILEVSTNNSEYLRKLLAKKYNLPEDISREDLLNYLENEVARILAKGLGLPHETTFAEISKISKRSSENAKYQ